MFGCGYAALRIARPHSPLTQPLRAGKLPDPQSSIAATKQARGQRVDCLSSPHTRCDDCGQANCLPHLRILRVLRRSGASVTPRNSSQAAKIRSKCNDSAANCRDTCHTKPQTAVEVPLTSRKRKVPSPCASISGPPPAPELHSNLRRSRLSPVLPTPLPLSTC